MKKLIAAVSAAILLVGMTACGLDGISAEAEVVGSGQISEKALLENSTFGNSTLKKDVLDNSDEESNAEAVLPNGAMSSTAELVCEVESKPNGGNSGTGSSNSETNGQMPVDGFHSPEATTAASQPPHTHNYIATILAPTCTDGGYTEHTCTCGENYRDAYTTALGHNFTDEVIPPTTNSQGYTRHLCLRCGYTYDDSFTESLPSRWDTEEAVADLCRRANAYIEAVGCILDPTAGSWAAPRYTGVKGVDMETCYQAVLAEIETYRAEGKTHLYVYYLSYSDAFQIYVAYNIIIS